MENEKNNLIDEIPTEERLQKVVARFGVCSRRAAEELITEGRIKVNGKVVNTLGTKVNIAMDRIAVDDQLLFYRPAYIYILLNKPTGYICSAADERGRRTVLDLLKGVEDRVFPVGRLDYATSGALLLTNDGELNNALLHPKSEIDKTYLAFVSGRVSPQKLEKLRQGVRLQDGITAPAKVRLSSYKDDISAVEITIHEGRNRQVRRMLEAVDCSCLRLKRIGFAGLTVDFMKPGAYRELTIQEVTVLRALTKKA